MPISVPPGLRDSIDRWCSCFEERRRAEELARDADETRTPRVCRTGPPRRRTPAPEHLAAARAVVELLDALEITGSRARLVEAGLTRIQLFGPYTSGGRPTWQQKGARWYALAPRSPAALVEYHRTSACNGSATELRTAEEVARTVPAAICLQIAADIERGKVWDRLRDVLTRGEV